MILDTAAAKRYLGQEVRPLLEGLTREHKPRWGKMTPQHMVEHLIVTLKLSMGRFTIPVKTPEERLPAVKALLLGDRPLTREVPSPVGNNDLQPLRSSSLQEAMEKLYREIGKYLEFVGENPGHIANHPYGGPLSPDEWLRFHQKHFDHHLRQFGLTKFHG